MDSENIVPLKSKRPRPDKTKSEEPKFPDPDLKRTKLLSATRMTEKHICLLLDITQEAYDWLYNNSIKFRDALERGRAEAILNCAQVVLMATQGSLGRKIVKTEPDGTRIETFGDFGENEREQLKAAKEYLSAHAPHWMADNK